MSMSLVWAVVAVASTGVAEPLRYGRPPDFQPYHYRHSPEQLRDLYSEDMRDRAAEEWRELEAVNAKGSEVPVSYEDVEDLSLEQMTKLWTTGGLFLNWVLGIRSQCGFATGQLFRAIALAAVWREGKYFVR